jgi:hypothetical protein
LHEKRLTSIQRCLKRNEGCTAEYSSSALKESACCKDNERFAEDPFAGPGLFCKPRRKNVTRLVSAADEAWIIVCKISGVSAATKTTYVYPIQDPVTTARDSV